MRFPNPVAAACLTCGRPTVVAETILGEVRVHCGTWRWQCDISGTGTGHGAGYALPPEIDLTALDAASEQELAA
ncbi:MAG: hypothetical protein ACRDSG_01875 [Pseudonocardiaceae bacterium]